jgi:hypothetical protein
VANTVVSGEGQQRGGVVKKFMVCRVPLEVVGKDIKENECRKIGITGKNVDYQDKIFPFKGRYKEPRVQIVSLRLYALTNWKLFANKLLSKNIYTTGC